MIAPFADIAVALRIEANELAYRAEDTEHVATAIGLFPATRAHVIAERRRQAELIGDAYRVIRALMAVENTVRAVMGVEDAG